MTTGQMELPLSTHSTPEDPTPEKVRTHPAQMIIKHCGKARKHVEHAYQDPEWFGCPGVPDLRDRHLVEQQAREAAERVLARDRLVREMELRRFKCHNNREFHDPHPVDGVICPGLTEQHCGNATRHDHHRWWMADAFHWCEGMRPARGIEDVELPRD